MKKLVLYFLLLMAVPATAQSGLFGSHSHHDSKPPMEHKKPGPPSGQHKPGPMIKAKKSSTHSSRREEVGMSSRDYEEAIQIINKENFDETRLNMAKRIIRGNPMSARQIVNICKLFTFEANRLEFAKFAYPYCVEPNKYFLVDDVFTFESSKQELDEYIRE